MSKILGIDYGRKKLGLSIAEGKLASPYKVLRVNSKKEAIEKIASVVKNENIKNVIVGISEGEMGEESLNFSISLAEKLDTPVGTWDETLSTRDAIRLSVEAGIKQKRRKKMEDAFAATIILQDYIDSTRFD